MYSIPILGNIDITALDKLTSLFSKLNLLIIHDNTAEIIG